MWKQWENVDLRACLFSYSSPGCGHCLLDSELAGIRPRHLCAAVLRVHILVFHARIATLAPHATPHPGSAEFPLQSRPLQQHPLRAAANGKYPQRARPRLEQHHHDQKLHLLGPDSVAEFTEENLAAGLHQLREFVRLSRLVLLRALLGDQSVLELYPGRVGGDSGLLVRLPRGWSRRETSTDGGVSFVGRRSFAGHGDRGQWAFYDAPHVGTHWEIVHQCVLYLWRNLWTGSLRQINRQ